MRLVRVEASAANEAEPEFDPEPTTRRNSTALMVTGIATSGLGGLIAGLGLLSSITAHKDCSGLYDESLRACEREEQDQLERGGRLLLIGAVAALAGIPLIIIGARHVPIEETNLRRQSHRESPRAALVVAGSGLVLRGEF